MIIYNIIFAYLEEKSSPVAFLNQSSPRSPDFLYEKLVRFYQLFLLKSGNEYWIFRDKPAQKQKSGFLKRTLQM